MLRLTLPSGVFSMSGSGIPQVTTWKDDLQSFVFVCNRGICGMHFGDASQYAYFKVEDKEDTHQLV
jgi:hypothetical protein